MTVSQAIALDFDVDITMDDFQDLPALLHRIRSEKPAAWVNAYGKPALLLTTYELANALLQDEQTFPAKPFYDSFTDVLGQNMLAMEGQTHRVHRALVSPSFRPRLMPQMMPSLLEPIAHELVDEIERRGSAELVADFTKVYPARIIMRLLGLPKHMDSEVQHWAMGMLDHRVSREESLKCSAAFTDFVQPILDQRRTDPGSDLLSMLATTEVDGVQLTDDEVFGFLKLLFPAGADTTYLNLGSTLYALLTFPEEMEKLRSDLQGRCSWAVDEGLRWYPSVSKQTRKAVGDRNWRGIDIPDGTMVLASILGANRDPAVFENPDKFDIERRPSRILTFGQGVHICLGMHLARAEMAVALRVLFERLPKLRWGDREGVRLHGVIDQTMRGPNALPVRFD